METKNKPSRELKLTPATASAIQFEEITDDIAFIRSADVCKLLNISNSTLKNLRAEHKIPFYKLGGTFLYNKEEIMNYLASNYSRRI